MLKDLRAAVLQACWTPEQLAGDPRDKTVTRPLNDPHRHDPPAYTAPKNSLPPLPATWRQSIRHIHLPAGEKAVALTFDLCERAKERAGYDAAVVDYLRAQQLHATFFAGGKWMRSHPEQAKQLMADPLFEIGSHAWSHGNCRLLGGDLLRHQILWPQVEYERLRQKLKALAAKHGVAANAVEEIPRVPLSFRFPYGACRPEALALLAEWGLPAIQWDVVTGDPARGQSAAMIARVVLRRVRPGSIIICHANGRGVHTAAALPLFVPKLRGEGFRFVTVSELLATGPAISSTECYENRPGDNSRYDHLSGEGTN